MHPRAVTRAIILSLCLALLATDALGARKRAAKPNPIRDAHSTLLAGLKSADFRARGMAYQGIVFDRKNREVRKLLKDGVEDPQWVVRAGIARGYMQLRDKAWRKVVVDALNLPTLQPFVVLPVLEHVKTKQAISVIVEALADKESERQPVIADAITSRNHDRTGQIVAALIGNKSPLVHEAGVRALKNMTSSLHAKHLITVAKKHGKRAEVAKILLDIGLNTRVGLDVSFLKYIKTKDSAVAAKVALTRGHHGDKSVSKAVLKFCDNAEGDELIKALKIYKGIAKKADAAKIKSLLGEDKDGRLTLAVYEILAEMDDRTMMRAADALAKGTNVHLRPTGVYYLGRVGGAGRLREMHEYLRDAIPDVRIASARVLAYIASKVSVPPLREGLDHEKNAAVKVELLKAMAAIKHKSAYEALRFYTREKQPEVRKLVVRALAESGDVAARQGLQIAIRDRSPDVRYEAVRGFLMSDPANAVRHFKRALGWLQPGAILRLTREFGPTFESYVQFALFSDRMAIREEAMDAIDLLPEQRTALLKRVMLKTDEDQLRVRLLHRLFELEGKKMADIIKQYAARAPMPTRIAAIRLLGKLKRDKGARELLIGTLNETNPNIRIAAALTLVGG